MSVEQPEGIETRVRTRRDQVLTAAAACFHAHGFHGASMAELAKQSGMSVGHIYHYFENKEAIIEAIVDRDLEHFLEKLDRLSMAEHPVEEMLLSLRESLMHCASRQRVLLRLEVLAEACRSPRVAAKVRAADAAGRSRFLEVMRSLDVLRSLPERELAARADTIAALFEGLTLRALRHPEIDLDTTLESARGALVALLRAMPTPAPSRQDA